VATLRRPAQACRPPTGRAAIVRAATGPARDTTGRQARALALVAGPAPAHYRAHRTIFKELQRWAALEQFQGAASLAPNKETHVPWAGPAEAGCEGECSCHVQLASKNGGHHHIHLKIFTYEYKINCDAAYIRVRTDL